MKKGDIVLIPFPFTNLSGFKTRPAVTLIVSEDDVVVSFITTKLKWQNQFDITLEPTIQNGLKKQSLIRLSKLSTLEKNLILGKIGSISDLEIMEINKNLIELLQLKK